MVVLFQSKYKLLLRFPIFMIFVKVDQLFDRKLPKIPKHNSSTLKWMFSEVKLNFTQPGKEQRRAHTAETEVRLNRALSHISRSSPVCSWAEVGTRWKERRQNGERGDDRRTTPIHSSSDAFSHLFGISGVVFLWASLRDIQARWDATLERPGRRLYQEGTLDTCGKVWLYKLKGWMSLQRNMDYPDSTPKSVGSLGFPFLSQVFFQWPELLTQTFTDL